MSHTKVYEQSVVFPTYRAGEPEKSPLFIEKRAYQGSTGKVYPVPVTETVSDTREDVAYKAVILENDYLYVMILPELGGRIQRAYDKTNGYDFVYFNHVIKPALVGLAGPWISGGIEFNWPQHHRPSTFMPVDYTFCENPDGSATVTLGETDRMYGTKGNAAITLYPDKAYIEIRGRLYNPTDFPQTFLWWANPAVSVNDQTFSVFPPDVNAVMDHGKRAVSTFPIATGEYYKADYSAGVDISRYKNIRVPTSYMAAHSDFDFVGNFDEGRDAGLLHVADHHVSPGKKQWTWGCGDFGKMWDRNLTDDDGPYIELMTGVFCDNQPDFTWLKPQEEKAFVQYFMPYKTVGRVCNATREAVLGVDYLDQDGNVLLPDPFATGREANAALAQKASCSRIKVYVTAPYPQSTIRVTCQGKECYRKTADLSPITAFVDTLPPLHDFVLTVDSASGETLCTYTEYVRENQPIPEPARVMDPPEAMGSAEELYLAGQHLEQYRHATFLPSDYYREGLRRDPTDIRLNDAYGLYLLRNARISESIPYFEAAIRKQTSRNPNPYSGEAYFHLGLAREWNSEPEKAYDAFFKATWSAETAGSAFFHLACLCLKAGDVRKALQFADESLFRSWHSMKARALRAAILARMPARQEEYAAFLQESLALDPLCFALLYRTSTPETLRKAMGEEARNYLNLALEFLAYGCYEDVLSVIRLCPRENPLLLYLTGYVENILGHREKALAACICAEKASPDYVFPNRVEEALLLKQAIEILETAGEKAGMAHYYLGELLYDKKNYDAAIAHWENSLAAQPGFALAHRNLSIALYNHGDRSRAASHIEEAVRLEPKNSRFLLEQEQLLSRLNRPVQERLAILEAHAEILPERYALMLAYIRLLNQVGQYEKALSLLSSYTFHVWEGGEGKVADEYKTALFALSEKALDKGEWEKAFDLAERTCTYPVNLGEGKLDNVPDNRAYYMMGLARKGQGDAEGAAHYFRLATTGSPIPEPVRYYNDQPSDYIYYQGLAFHALGQDAQALKSFHQLIMFGERHMFDKVSYDFFAVSMPELEVYQDDIQKRSDDYCARMMLLGRRGLDLLEK